MIMYGEMEHTEDDAVLVYSKIFAWLNWEKPLKYSVSMTGTMAKSWA